MYDMEEAQGTSLLTSNDSPYDDRILRCLVSSPAGRAIYKYEKKSELLEALRDAIKAHRSLYVKGNILHRDIFENNIIITDPKRTGFTGMLIDLDLAIAQELGDDPSGPAVALARWSSWLSRCCKVLTIPIGMILSRFSMCLSGNALVVAGVSSWMHTTLY
jgi:Fungal protein kinase